MRAVRGFSLEEFEVSCRERRRQRFCHLGGGVADRKEIRKLRIESPRASGFVLVLSLRVAAEGGSLEQLAIMLLRLNPPEIHCRRARMHQAVQDCLHPTKGIRAGASDDEEWRASLPSHNIHDEILCIVDY